MYAVTERSHTGESPEQLVRNERLARCEVMLIVQGEELKGQRAQLKDLDEKLDGIIEYVNARKGAFRLAERIGLFFITLGAAAFGTLLSWWHQK